MNKFSSRIMPKKFLPCKESKWTNGTKNSTQTLYVKYYTEIFSSMGGGRTHRYTIRYIYIYIEQMNYLWYDTVCLRIIFALYIFKWWKANSTHNPLLERRHSYILHIVNAHLLTYAIKVQEKGSSFFQVISQRI